MFFRDFVFKVLGNFFQKAYPFIFVVIVNGLCTIVYKKTVVHRVATSDNEWQRVTTSVTRNENGTVDFKEWIIAILTMTKTDTLLQGMDGTLTRIHITVLTNKSVWNVNSSEKVSCKNTALLKVASFEKVTTLKRQLSRKSM